ncbi:MAG: family 10 glycosylhydrolase [Aphanizomenon flos-aquae KM1D3_PB]|nr:MAG: family 10 glycosylhydrolase [Aphanizomenon flos-aquae KM1D3_PB]
MIPLSQVKDKTDWGKPSVLFLPNVEVLTTEQAIALDQWVSQGGYLIASGPVGNLSTPGVRQLLRKLLGGYWGFSFNTIENLQPTNTNIPDWINQKELFGAIRGGVIIPNNSTSQTPVSWDSQDHPPAILTTEKSTLLGWYWGKDTSVGLDIAWLKASLNRYLRLPVNSKSKLTNPASNCQLTIATEPTQPQILEKLPIASESPPPKKIPKKPIATSKSKPTKKIFKKSTLTSQSKPLKKTTITSHVKPAKKIAKKTTVISRLKPATKITVTSQLQPNPKNTGSLVVSKITNENFIDPINQLEENVRLDVIPNSNQPINQKEGIALQKELENLIGRLESTHIAVLAYNSAKNINNNGTNSPLEKAESIKTASSNPETSASNLAETLVQARETVKSIPLLIQQKNYVTVRQKWLQAKANLWQQFPVNQRLAQPEIRAMWLDRGTIVKAGNEVELAKIFDKLAKAGINTIFLETVNASYPIYPSQVAPQQNPLIRDWDPLESAVKLAHARGMELHAWVWVFAAGNNRHNEIINVGPDYLGPVLAANPDWANYDNRGNIIPIGQTKPFLDPANPQVREYLTKLYTEIVTRYQVDGIHLDYIRYPFQDSLVGRSYGYGKAAREQFKQQTGIDPLDISPSQRDLWQQWTAFRTQKVDSFVAELSQTLRQKRNTLILSVAVFPLPEYERVEKIQQHWEVWARRGDIDLIVPMTYALDTPRFQGLAQPWITSTKLGATLLVPGIRLKSLPTMGAFDQLQLLRDLPVNGYALFAAENFHPELEQIFNSTQGIKNEPIPQRQPFRTAAFRYAALQREWRVVEKNSQLHKSAITNTEFEKLDQELKDALNQLASVPSALNLITARKALNQVQLQFSQIPGKNQANFYQVKVWENRLLAIERLIRFGERRLNMRQRNGI